MIIADYLSKVNRIKENIGYSFEKHKIDIGILVEKRKKVSETFIHSDSDRIKREREKEIAEIDRHIMSLLNIEAPKLEVKVKKEGTGKRLRDWAFMMGYNTETGVLANIIQDAENEI